MSSPIEVLEKPAPAEIHISDVLTYKQCRLRWKWSSVLRDNLTPIGVYAPFFAGSAIHYALNYLYRYGITTDEALDHFLTKHEAEQMSLNPAAYQADLPVIEQQAMLVRGMLTHYVQWSNSDKSRYADRHLEFVANEEPFTVPIYTPRGYLARGMVFSGRYDGIVRSRLDGKLYLWEIKTTRSITERIKMLSVEAQANAYAIAAQHQLKEPIAGIIYTILRKKLPDTIPVLKNGFLSKNQQLDVTAEQYISAIRAQHQHDATADFISTYYGDFLEMLLARGNTFFARVCVLRTQQELKHFADELYYAAREMIARRTPIYRGEGTHCNYCRYREPCIARYNGGEQSAEAILASSYVQNTYHLKTEEDL